MVTSIVSVRMPPSLVQKLRELAKENHFLDISEEIRSIIKVEIRQYEMRAGALVPSEEEAKPADFKTDNMVKEELVKRLKRMIEEITRE